MFGLFRSKTAPSAAPLADYDREREELPLPVEQLEAALDGTFWRWFEAEAENRLKRTRDFLESNELVIEGMPRFESLHARDQYLKGQCSELRWMLEGPRTLLEIMKSELKEQQGHE